MCLYPRLIENRKFKPNKKNGGIVPPLPLWKGKPDVRVKAAPKMCMNCFECMKAKARDWTVRLLEEIREYPKQTFVTLTFDTEHLQELSNEIEHVRGYERDNAIATLAVRRFMERWRKKYKVTLKHWLITEIGGGRYEHIHLHGLVQSTNIKDIREKWHYGFVYEGDYVGEDTVHYIVKYLHKKDEKHKEYKPKILNSPGIGACYIGSINQRRNVFRGIDTNETYKTPSGLELPLPVYYRNKIYTEEQREFLWLMKLDKQKRYVLGSEIDVSKTNENYYNALVYARRLNKEMKYGTSYKDWDRDEYENKRRDMLLDKRIITTIEKKNREEVEIQDLWDGEYEAPF